MNEELNKEFDFVKEDLLSRVSMTREAVASGIKTIMDELRRLGLGERDALDLIEDEVQDLVFEEEARALCAFGAEGTTRNGQ